MMQRRLGFSDLFVSTVGLGCNNFSRPGTATETVAGTKAVLDAAREHEITFLDTAELYGAEPGGSEEFMGQALKGRRDSFIIASKFGHRAGGPEGSDEWGPQGGAEYITSAVEGSLRRLRTDRIDLYQIHTPDPDTPIGDTLEALAGLVGAGKVRCIGHSNFSADQMIEADQVARDLGLPRFVSAQNEYSLLARGVEDTILPTAASIGLGFLPYFPLFNGLLTGKYGPDSGEGRITQLKPELLDKVDWGQLDAMRAICEMADISMVVGAIGWLLANQSVSSVIAGATTPAQIAANAAAGDRPLPPTVVAQLSEVFTRP